MIELYILDFNTTLVSVLVNSDLHFLQYLADFNTTLVSVLVTENKQKG